MHRAGDPGRRDTVHVGLRLRRAPSSEYPVPRGSDYTRGMELRVQTFTGRQIAPHVDDLARLRIAVFRDWPYLYDGDADYETKYLAAYANSADSVFVIAFDGERAVGVSSGIPLTDDTDTFRKPFRERGFDVARVFYFGESVLLREYRGRGLGHRFFDAREAHARALGRFGWTAFCAVDREPDDPRRPAGHRDNDAFWRGRGYAKQDGMCCTLAWKEIGVGAQAPHTLSFWLREL